MNDVLNPFDLASLRLDQTYSDGIAVKKLITMIRVGKPSSSTSSECIRIRHTGSHPWRSSS